LPFWAPNLTWSNLQQNGSLSQMPKVPVVLNATVQLALKCNLFRDYVLFSVNLCSVVCEL